MCNERNDLLVTLEGVYAKVKRAQDQLRLLDADITEFCASQRRLIEHEVDQDAGIQMFVFRGETPQVPINYSVRIGEIIYNLRSALDHLVWQLVLSNGEEPGTNNEYPIYSDRTRYTRAVERKLRGVSTAAQSVIEAYQPFQRPGGIGSQLWNLHSMSNFDKHRRLNMVVAYSNGPRLRIMTPDSDSRMPVQARAPIGKLKTNMELAVLYDLDVVVEPNFRIEVRFESSNLKPVLNSESSLDEIIDNEFAFVEKNGTNQGPVVQTIEPCLDDVQRIIRNLEACVD